MLNVGEVSGRGRFYQARFCRQTINTWPRRKWHGCGSKANITAYARDALVNIIIPLTAKTIADSMTFQSIEASVLTGFDAI